MDVVTLGETMVLFTPETTGLMRYAKHFSTKVAGAESNVAIGLARLGHRAGWMSRIGDDEFGRMVLSFIRGEGVDVTGVQLDAEAPTSLFFKEKLAPGDFRVQYYRKHFAASKMAADDLDEDYIANAQYLHITGITPALSASCRETVLRAIEIANKYEVRVVFDPNLRRKLWDEGVARETLLQIAAKADIVLPGIDEAQFLFGNGEVQTLAEKFIDHGASTVVVKLGAQGAYYIDSSDKGTVSGLPVETVMDPVGAGDGFAAGFLSGLLDGLSVKSSVQRANAVGAMVTLVEGDVEGLPDKGRLSQFIRGAGEDVSR